MLEEVQVAMREPVGDQERERMLGTRRVEVDSEKRTGLSGLRAEGRTSFLMGRESGRDILAAAARSRGGRSLYYGVVSILRSATGRRWIRSVKVEQIFQDE